MRGSFTFVLHSHLPYVINHGEWPHGTDWLYEAAAETYIPIWKELKLLVEDGIKPAVTLGITPVLMEQLVHPRFKAGFKHYLTQKIETAKNDEIRFHELKQFDLVHLATQWVEFFTEVRDLFADVNEDILAGFRDLQDNGGLELITCGATHGYFPLLGTDESISAQIAVGIQTFEKHMGRKPFGFWIPECAYRPSYEWTSPINGKSQLRAGLEELLFEHGLEYFIVDKHLIIGGENRGVYIDRFESLKTLWANFSKGWNPPAENKARSVFQPYLVSSTGTERAVAVFGRHEESALQVWSAEWGYPGNPAYLEFHRKHFPSGHKYWRVTGRDIKLGDKKIYHPEWIEEALEEQAEHYVNLITKHLDDNRNSLGKPGIIVAPFDTELFGHWWFEGPRWLGKVLRKLSNKEINPTTCGKYLNDNPPQETITLPEGSWGQGGFHYIWLNDWTEWTWKEIYQREERFRELVDQHVTQTDDIVRRLLQQMARELLLLEASDWQFLISTWSARDYAEQRVMTHASRFDELDTILKNYLNEETMSKYLLQRISFLENEDAVFEDIDISQWEARSYLISKSNNT